MASNRKKILIFQEPQSRAMLNFFLFSKRYGNVANEVRRPLAKIYYAIRQTLNFQIG